MLFTTVVMAALALYLWADKHKHKFFAKCLQLEASLESKRAVRRLIGAEKERLFLLAQAREKRIEEMRLSIYTAFHRRSHLPTKVKVLALTLKYPEDDVRDCLNKFPGNFEPMGNDVYQTRDYKPRREGNFINPLTPGAWREMARTNQALGF